MNGNLTATQVAARLGVKQETVYAYVSRGILHRRLAEDGRTSRFDAAEVEALARRGRPRANRRQVGSVDVVLASALTSIVDDRLRYRGHDVVELTRTATFEQVAELLWAVGSGDEPADREAAAARALRRAPAVAWPLDPTARRLVRAVTAPLPDRAPVAERLAVVAAALAAVDPLLIDRDPEAVRAHARTLVVAFVEALPRRRPGPTATAPTGDPAEPTRPRRRHVANALWPHLSPLPPTRARVRVLDAALVLLADHELATSTLAVRVAASTGANPYAALLAGLGAASGPLHGKAGVAALRMVTDAGARRAAGDPGAVPAAVADALAVHGRIPGVGHAVYQGPDPRAVRLLELVAGIAARRRRAVLDELLTVVAATTRAQPNVDLALAALAWATDMDPQAPEAIFEIARTAGWIAHVLEEYGEAPLRFRARALYTG